MFVVILNIHELITYQVLKYHLEQKMQNESDSGRFHLVVEWISWLIYLSHLYYFGMHVSRIRIQNKQTKPFWKINHLPLVI